MNRYHLPVALLALLALALLPQAQAQEPDERCFSETGECVSGRILEYWEQYGDVAIFGLPITPQREETIEGQALELQWFERNRLELHPANEPPYDVLLGRLGVDVLAAQGRDWQGFATDDGPQEGCRYFEQTGFNVCGEILDYWSANGLELDGQPGFSDAESLALFGLPISPLQTEEIEGQPLEVQWFERARFELHPENNPPFNVLLGLLGNELRELTTDAPAAEATPTPADTLPTAAPTAAPPPTATPSGDTSEPQRNEQCFAPVVPGDAPESPLRIVGIDKIEEVVTLANVGSELVDLAGWTMCSVVGNEEHLGLVGVLEPGEQGDYAYTGAGRIWENGEPDDGMLFDPDGLFISYWDDPIDS